MSHHERAFQFYQPDGSIGADTTTDYLKSIGLNDEQINERQRQHEAHYVSETYNERIWRNDQLNQTDKLLPEDATYNGQPVRDTDYYAQIMEYRKALREYDLKYMPRPVPPDWF